MASASAPRKSAPPRRRGPYAKSSETRDRILAAALAVAGEVGLNRATVARIAERAGMAVGNLHYHFGSRDELLRECSRWVRDTLLDEVRAAAAGADFLAAERAGLRAYLAFVHRNPGYVRLVEEVRVHHPDLYREGIEQWLAWQRENLERGVARGELRALGADEIAALSHLLLGARYFLDQMIEGVDGRTYPGDDAVVDAYLALIRGGLEKETA
ncbi:MAG: TetR/AcrR family transcriptional regulator [Myxococcota bacterium]|nr:TetR/AcrR family transcriptional regulator [Myxococcota bacterium]